ncbi:hypothetical protein CR155_07345 [Pollutimonas nitritireducens]|uniref:Uncharacterized protein n=1 Tax=Pollutimonas nitritireducens TaxID=2045209 RepID=A0A2N4UHS4_9BURK|nr:hypothetical protein CR155_07345 [Pollutimonas nitritireducens]
MFPWREERVCQNITTMAARLLIARIGGGDNAGFHPGVRAIQLVLGVARDKVNAGLTQQRTDN